MTIQAEKLPFGVNETAPTSPASSPLSSCAILVLDEDGLVATVNRAARALWQADEREFTGESFAALFTADDGEEISWPALLAQSLDRVAALHTPTHAGPPRAVHLRLEQIYAPAGGYLAVVQPVASISVPPAPAADHASEGLRLLVEKSVAGFFDLQLSTGRVQFSPAWKKIVGYADNELPDTLATWRQLIHPDDSAAAPDHLRGKILDGSRPFNTEFRMRHRLGHWVWVQSLGLQLTDEHGLLGRVVGLHLDITERKELEETALAGDARLHELSDTGPLAAFELDFTAKNFWFSPAWEKLLGYAVGELPPALASFTAALPEDAVEAGAETWLLARAPGQSAFLETASFRKKVGRPIRVLFGAHRTLTRKRELTRVVGFAVALPAELTLSPDELVKANRFESLALLTGGIAREFNGHLATMLGAVSLAKDRDDETALADAETAGLAAKSLTKQLLAFASGDTAPQRTVATAKSLLTEALAFAGAASPAEFSLEIADGVADVLADRAQLLQVFQNLILNAQQAMPPPPHVPRLQLRAANASVADNQVPGLAAGDYVAFEICDNGSGIAPEHVEKIFGAFFTTRKHGTGLGLSTARSLVVKHGGQIAVDSEPGNGSAFTVYLPRADQHPDVRTRRAASQRFGTGRVLVMEDDAKIAGVTAAMLRALDYKCDLATNGTDAVALYKRYQNIGRPYDVVILDDTVAGGMGGEECFRALRELDPEVRAILASGDDREDIARHSLDQGFCGYLTKPYRVSELGRMLKTVLG